jgi:hypothetical protein
VEQDEVAAVLARPIAQELLGSDVPARLAYTGRDDDPRVVPVAFWWDGSRITVCTVPGSAKVAAIRERPRVALTVDTTGHPPHVLLVRGAAEVEVVDGVPHEYVAASRKLVPPDAFPAWEAGVRALYERMVRITVTPDHAVLLDFATTIPRAVAELVEAASR